MIFRVTLKLGLSDFDFATLQVAVDVRSDRFLIIDGLIEKSGLFLM